MGEKRIKWKYFKNFGKFFWKFLTAYIATFVQKYNTSGVIQSTKFTKTKSLEHFFNLA